MQRRTFLGSLIALATLGRLPKAKPAAAPAPTPKIGDVIRRGDRYLVVVTNSGATAAAGEFSITGYLDDGRKVMAGPVTANQRLRQLVDEHSPKTAVEFSAIADFMLHRREQVLDEYFAREEAACWPMPQ